MPYFVDTEAGERNQDQNPMVIDCPDMWPAKSAVNMASLDDDGIGASFTLHDRDMKCSLTLVRVNEVCQVEIAG